jgi:hypothetical protein
MALRPTWKRSNIPPSAIDLVTIGTRKPGREKPRCGYSDGTQSQMQGLGRL